MKYILLLINELGKNPLAVITAMLLIALGYLYNDVRCFLTTQTATIQDISVELREHSLRLQRLEEYHLQQLQKEHEHELNKDKNL